MVDTLSGFCRGFHLPFLHRPSYWFGRTSWAQAPKWCQSLPAENAQEVATDGQMERNQINLVLLTVILYFWPCWKTSLDFLFLKSLKQNSCSAHRPGDSPGIICNMIFKQACIGLQGPWAKRGCPISNPPTKGRPRKELLPKPRRQEGTHVESLENKGNTKFDFKEIWIAPKQHKNHTRTHCSPKKQNNPPGPPP